MNMPRNTPEPSTSPSNGLSLVADTPSQSPSPRISALPNWIWPRQLNLANNAGVRFGRVLHWVALVLSAPWVILAAAVLVTPDATDRAGMVGLFLVIALACASVGRGLRYIFASE